MNPFDTFPFLDQEQPLPPKFSDVIEGGWTFPERIPVVNNSTSPEAGVLLIQVIEYLITQHYKNHRICSYNVAIFETSFASNLYKVMLQHQYWIDQFLGLIEDNQFFYNEEWNEGGTQTNETIGRNTTTESNSLSKTSDTPQSQVTDLDTYLSEATKNEGNENGTDDSTRANTFTTDLHVKRSTLGDITVQFKNFANFPAFTDKIINAVAPSFFLYYGQEDIDYGTSQ